MLAVKDLMNDKLFTLRESDTLRDARSIMGLARIRHIPIVDDKGFFAGLVTHRDILDAAVSRFADIDSKTRDEIDEGIPVAEIMQREVLTVPSSMNLRKAAGLLLTNKYGCLPVVDNQRLVGIVTESDFLRLTISLMDAVDK